MRAALKNLSARTRLAAVLFAPALLLLSAHAGPVRARGQEEEPPARPGAGVRRQRRGPNLMQRLGLTQEQRLRLREIRTREEPATRELARRVRHARRALDEAIYADALDEALVEQRSRELAAAQAELTRQRAATELKVRRVLTPEQLGLFRNLRREAQQRQMFRRRSRGARRQPPPGAPAESTPGEDEGPEARPAPRRPRP